MANSSYDDEVPDSNYVQPDPETSAYQVFLCHAEEGFAPLCHPHWDLGVFTITTWAATASFLSAAATHLGCEYFEDEPENFVQAWACPSYLCWLLPRAVELPCFTYGNDGLVEVARDKDPR